MIVGVLRLQILLHSPRSLKEKRGAVKSILGRCRSRFPVSCAETGDHDLWQRAELGFSAVGSDEGTLHAIFEKIESETEMTGAEIIDRFVEFIHY